MHLLPLAIHAATAILGAATPDHVPGAGHPDRSSIEVRTGVSEVRVRRAPGEIRVDGDLDDPGWAGAVRITEFTEYRPTQGAEPPARTEVWITYDDARLYLAFIAYGDPHRLRASRRERDQVGNDDLVGVVLDPFGTAAAGVALLANPHGIQFDVRMTRNGLDPGYDLIYDSAGRITEYGYRVEMAIPFTSLRFPARSESGWGINFYRAIPLAVRHELFWAPVAQDNPCTLCQNGRLLGLEGVRREGALELLPALVGSWTGELAEGANRDSGLTYRSPTAEPSLGVKYVARGGWVAEGTYNPDFSQIESDAAQTDVNTSLALFHPERRPFFQEGGELFLTWINVLHTRSINSPRFAGKLSGRVGGTEYAYLGARDEATPFVLPFPDRSRVLRGGLSTSNAVRVRHDLPGNSQVGVLMVDRRIDGGGSGTNLSADGLFRFGPSHTLQLQVVASRTVEPDDPELTAAFGDAGFGRGSRRYTEAFDGETFSGHAAHVQFQRHAPTWSFRLQASEVSPTYRADVGFQRRNDFRRATAVTSLGFDRPGRFLYRIQPSLQVIGRWNFDGAWRRQTHIAGVTGLLKGHTQVDLTAETGRERFMAGEFTGLHRGRVAVSSGFSERLGLDGYIAYGRYIAQTLDTPVAGPGLGAEASAAIRPIPRLQIRPRLYYGLLRNGLTGEIILAGYIAGGRADYQFTRELSSRLFAEYDEFTGQVRFEPLVTYRLNPFSVFHAGSASGFASDGENAGRRAVSRQYFVKFQYLLRR